MQRDILSEKIYCPEETVLLMASYQVQAKYGDYDGKKHSSGYLADEDLFPQQHKLSVPMWEKKVYVGGKSDLQEGPDTIFCFSSIF